MKQLEEWDDAQTDPDRIEAGHDAPEREQQPDVDHDDHEGPQQDDVEEDDAQKDQDAPDLLYPTVEAFVTGWLAPTYGRYIGTGNGARTWCPMWWKHPEGLVRLTAIWRAWEHLRQDATLGMSIFLLEHADPHMAVLFDASGPFKGCTPERGHDPRSKPLPLGEADSRIFPSTADIEADIEAASAQQDTAAPTSADEVSDPAS